MVDANGSNVVFVICKRLPNVWHLMNNTKVEMRKTNKKTSSKYSMYNTTFVFYQSLLIHGVEISICVF